MDLVHSHKFPPAQPHKLENLRGPGYSNIILRDALFHGGHPGSSPAEIVSSLKPLLLAGVTTFVCLQQELPSAATAAAAQSRATTRLGGGAAKPYISGAQAMVDAGGACIAQMGAQHATQVHARVAHRGTVARKMVGVEKYF